MRTIPLGSEPKQTMTLPLGARSFRLRVRWNTVMGSWYLDAEAADGSKLLSGHRLVVAFPFRFGSPATNGMDDSSLLLLVDSSGQNRDPGRDSLGTTHFLLLLGDDDVAQLGG